MTGPGIRSVVGAVLAAATLVTAAVASARSTPTRHGRDSFAALAPSPGRWAAVGRDGAAEGGRPAPGDLALVIADNVSRRVLVTDLGGRVLWQWRNPTGRSSAYSGPLGVRWARPGKVLATFGTGEVGLIDVRTKTFDWKVTRLGGEYLRSPYDAQVLPDGNLAVVLRRNHGGMVGVYDPHSHRLVWQVRVHEVHTMLYRSAAQSYDSRRPTIMVGAKGRIAEYVYRPGHAPRLVWQRHSRWSHDLLPVGDGSFLSQDGTYVHRFRHAGADLWRSSSRWGVARRMALDPAHPGWFVEAGGSQSNVQFRRVSDGSLVRQWSRLSDGTRLHWPYGLRVIARNELPRAVRHG